MPMYIEPYPRVITERTPKAAVSLLYGGWNTSLRGTKKSWDFGTMRKETNTSDGSIPTSIRSAIQSCIDAAPLNSNDTWHALIPHRSPTIDLPQDRQTWPMMTETHESLSCIPTARSPTAQSYSLSQSLYPTTFMTLNIHILPFPLPSCGRVARPQLPTHSHEDVLLEDAFP